MELGRCVCVCVCFLWECCALSFGACFKVDKILSVNISGGDSKYVYLHSSHECFSIFPIFSLLRTFVTKTKFLSLTHTHTLTFCLLRSRCILRNPINFLYRMKEIKMLLLRCHRHHHRLSSSSSINLYLFSENAWLHTFTVYTLTHNHTRTAYINTSVHSSNRRTAYTHARRSLFTPSPHSNTNAHNIRWSVPWIEYKFSFFNIEQTKMDSSGRIGIATASLPECFMTFVPLYTIHEATYRRHWTNDE